MTARPAVGVEVEHLYKIFGRRPRRAMSMVEQGHGRAEIFERTGMMVGVDDASFTIEPGEIFVVMGLSGSGKSTLLRMINRLIEPTAGRVRVGDRDVTAMSRRELIELRRENMSMVFQSFALLPHLTVVQNTAFGLEVAGVDKQPRTDAALAALAQVGLEEHAASYPRELSGGMQQRVGLARALAADPTLMLMDEAFSALDPLIRAEMQDELLRLQSERPRTIVFISHDLDEAMRIGDRIAIMEAGRIVQVGAPEEILTDPANDFVRSFFRGVDVSKVYNAGDVASRDEVTIVRRHDHGVRTALEHLRERHRDVGYVEDKNRRFVGVVSVESLLRELDTESPNLEHALLEVEALDAKTPLAQAIPRVTRSAVPVPVLDDDGHYRGAISKTALLETLHGGT